MEVESLADALKSIMKDGGWTQTQLALELGESQPWVSQVINGKKDTSLSRAIEVLGRVGWIVRMRPDEEVEPVRRREFVAAAAAVAFVPSPKTTPFENPTYVANLAIRVAERRHEFGGIPIAKQALNQARRVGQIAMGSRNKALQSSAAELAKEAALALYDARGLSAAMQIGGLSTQLARTANNTSVQSIALSILSQVSAYRGDGSRAALYAQQALDLPGITDANRAYLLARLGRGLSMTGEDRAARSTLDLARTVAENAPPLEAADVRGNVGIALGNMGLHDEAQREIGRTVSVVEGQSPLYYACYLVARAEDALNAEHPELAAEVMRHLALVAPMVSSGRISAATREIFANSSQWVEVREMREAREHLRLTLDSA